MIKYVYHILAALIICSASPILNMSSKDASQFTREELELVSEKLETHIKELQLPEKETSLCKRATNMHAISLFLQETATSLHVPDRFSNKTVTHLIAMHTALEKSVEEHQDIFAQDEQVKISLEKAHKLAQEEHTELKLTKLMHEHHENDPMSFTKYVSDVCGIL